MEASMGTPPRFTGAVEVSPAFAPRPRITHVLFDFDGTLSLVREGWPAVMTGMFVEVLPKKAGETDEELAPTGLANDGIMEAQRGSSRPSTR